MTYTPERGDIVWVDVRRDGGGAAAERRPGLVLSRRDFNDATGFMLVCPISTRGKGGPFERALPPEAGVGAAGVVIVSELRALDWLARRAEKTGAAPAPLVDAVAAVAKAMLDG